jgi:hypothetical protein
MMLYRCIPTYQAAKSRSCRPTNIITAMPVIDKNEAPIGMICEEDLIVS